MKTGRWISLTLVSPWLLTFLFFWIFPLSYSLYMGFTDGQLLTHETHWVGLDNYRALLDDPAFLSSLKNTFVFVLGTIPVTTIIALLLALLVNHEFPGRGLFRAGFFLPWITSMVVIALIFTNLYERGGYVAMLAEMAGFTPPQYGFLYDNRTALYSIMAMDIWMSVGYYMLIFLAGLKAIPEELYESAEIVGASWWRQFRSITLPLLRPVALFIIVVNSIKSFQVFVEIFVMTKGKYETATVVYYMYDTGLTTNFKFGYASAIAWSLFLLVAVISIAQFALLRRRESIW